MNGRHVSIYLPGTSDGVSKVVGMIHNEMDIMAVWDMLDAEKV